MHDHDDEACSRVCMTHTWITVFDPAIQKSEELYAGSILCVINLEILGLIWGRSEAGQETLYARASTYGQETLYASASTYGQSSQRGIRAVCRSV